jgi:hypothetical protein
MRKPATMASHDLGHGRIVASGDRGDELVVVDIAEIFPGYNPARSDRAHIHPIEGRASVNSDALEARDEQIVRIDSLLHRNLRHEVGRPKVSPARMGRWCRAR